MSMCVFIETDTQVTETRQRGREVQTEGKIMKEDKG